MSAMTAWPPPNDSSDSGAKPTASAIRLSPTPRISAAPPLRPGEANADRDQAQHDRDQRPVQDADAQHGHRDDAPRHGPGRAMDAAAQPGGEGQADHRGRDAVEHVV